MRPSMTSCPFLIFRLDQTYQRALGRLSVLCGMDVNTLWKECCKPSLMIFIGSEKGLNKWPPCIPFACPCTCWSLWYIQLLLQVQGGVTVALFNLQVVGRLHIGVIWTRATCWSMHELEFEDRSFPLCGLLASPLFSQHLRKYCHHKLPPSLSWCPHFHAQVAMEVGSRDFGNSGRCFLIGENLQKEMEWAGVIKPKEEEPVGLFNTALYGHKHLVGDRKESIIVLFENSVFCPSHWVLSFWKLGSHRIPLVLWWRLYTCQ